MSKELTALEALKNIRALFTGSSIDLSYQLNIIEAALERLEDLQNKYNVLETKYFDQRRSMLNYDEVKQIKLKALNLIKEKGVNVGDFIDTFIIEELNYQHYLDYHDNYSYKLLDKADFYLLKEVLK